MIEVRPEGYMCRPSLDIRTKFGYTMLYEIAPLLAIFKILERFRKLKKSEEEFKGEIKKDPEDAIAHYNLGIVYSNIGRLDDAIEEYKLAIKYCTRHKANSDILARVWFDLGVDYQQSKMIDKAITAYEKSLLYNPNYIEAKINLDQIKRLMYRR